MQILEATFREHFTISTGPRTFFSMRLIDSLRLSCFVTPISLGFVAEISIVQYFMNGVYNATHLKTRAPQDEAAPQGSLHFFFQVKDDVKFDLNKLAAGEMFCVNCTLGPSRWRSWCRWRKREILAIFGQPVMKGLGVYSPFSV